MMDLLQTAELLQSPVVANCRMNRERQLTGSNGYARELGFDIAAFLHESAPRSPVRWLDVCCGSGRALLEAATLLSQTQPNIDLQIDGIDLAGAFLPNRHPRVLRVHETPIEDFELTSPYTLITCVHGLHYIGDKLALLSKLIRSLSPTGLFLANLDLSSIRHPDNRTLSRPLARLFRNQNIAYNSRRKLLRSNGPIDISFPFAYLGSNDSLGPNYTGHPAVVSYYRPC